MSVLRGYEVTRTLEPPRSQELAGWLQLGRRAGDCRPLCFALLSSHFQAKPTHSLHTTTDELLRLSSTGSVSSAVWSGPPQSPRNLVIDVSVTRLRGYEDIGPCGNSGGGWLIAACNEGGWLSSTGSVSSAVWSRPPQSPRNLVMDGGSGSGLRGYEDIGPPKESGGGWLIATRKEGGWRSSTGSVSSAVWSGPPQSPRNLVIDVSVTRLRGYEDIGAPKESGVGWVAATRKEGRWLSSTLLCFAFIAFPSETHT